MVTYLEEAKAVKVEVIDDRGNTQSLPSDRPTGKELSAVAILGGVAGATLGWPIAATGIGLATAASLLAKQNKVHRHRRF